MAGRAQGNTPGQQKQVQTTHFYRDLAPAPRSHTAPTDATSKRHESGLDLLQAVGNGLFQGVDESLHQVLPGPRSSARYAWTRALVDAPGGLDRSVALVGEQGLEALGLGVGEQVGPRAQGASGLVERVARPAPPAGGLGLDAAAALVELVSC